MNLRSVGNITPRTDEKIYFPNAASQNILYLFFVQGKGRGAVLASSVINDIDALHKSHPLVGDRKDSRIGQSLC